MYIYIHTYTHHILYMYIIRLQFFCFDPDPLIVNLVNTAKDSRLHNGFAESGGQERTQVTLGLSTQLPSHWFWTRHSSRILRLTQHDQALSYFRKRCSSLDWNDIMKTLPGQPGVPEKGCRLSKGCFDPKDVFRKPKETPVFHGGKQVCNRYTVDEIMQPIIIHVLFP